MHIRFIFLLVMVFVTSCGPGFRSDSLPDEIDLVLSKHWKPGQPGLAVLVWEDGKILSENYMGKTGQEPETSITGSGVFRMASVSKQFTAMAVLLLEKEGKLKQDHKLSDYFPELPAVWAGKISLTHLLTHTSGITDYETLMGNTGTEQIQDEDIPALLQSESGTYFEPGSAFRYSNTAYCLLSLIVEKVAGIPYRQFVKQKIFTPLAMNNTFIYDAQQPQKDRVLGFSKDIEGNVIPADQSQTSATKGDGCVYTSVHDYLKWYLAIRDNTLVDLGKKLDETGFRFKGERTKGYGAGWFFNVENNIRELTHTGSTSGFSNVVIQVPEKDLLILMFSNVAGNHNIFNELDKVIREHVDYQWQLNWEEMHHLTN